MSVFAINCKKSVTVQNNNNNITITTSNSDERRKIIQKEREEWYLPLILKISKNDMKNLKKIYKKVSEDFFKTRGEFYIEETPSTREEMFQKISFRLEYLSQIRALERLEVKKIVKGLY